MVNLTSIVTHFCLYSLFILPTLLAFSSMTPNVSPLQLTLHMPGAGQMTPIGGVANQLLKPEDRIKDFHMRMNEKHSPPIPKDRKQEASLLNQNQKPILDRIQNVANHLNQGKVTPGELLQQMPNAKHYTKGKVSNSAVFELVRPALEMDKQKEEKHIFEKEKRKKEEEKIALAATKVVLEEMKKKEKKAVKEAIKEVKKEMKIKNELKKMMHHGNGHGHNHHHKKENKNKVQQKEHQKLKKANQNQAGFMAIVTHPIYKPSEKLSKKKSKGQIPKLKYPKDVHNLLWTAVSLAREQLAEGKANSPICLLEFLAHMVGGAFAPFIDRKNEKYMKGQHGFLHKIRHYTIPFLSSGYMAFWREKLGTKGFEEYEKKVNPVFINHEF